MPGIGLRFSNTRFGMFEKNFELPYASTRIVVFVSDYFDNYRMYTASVPNFPLMVDDNSVGV